jgi:RNA polymerase sigma-70 factor, ECF subfamily
MAELGTRPRTRYRDEPDVVLVAAAQRGEREALDALLRRHHDRIFAVCRRVTSNPADAADATQEALMAIARGIGRFDGTSAFTTWAYRVATNASLDELRRRNRRPVPADDEALGASGTRLLTGGAPTLSSHDVDARVDIDRALAILPPDWRAALVLRDLCGLDYAEIAEVLGIPGGTVRSRIARARAALAPALTNRDEADLVTDGPDRGIGNHDAASGRQKETHVD